MSMARIEIDMSKPCPRCGKPGAANGGPCLKCILKALKAGELDERLNAARDTNDRQGAKREEEKP
mgnify:CR=1 FL=1